ncbi:MAG: hypothetical protein ACTHK3_06625 [Solirubrobacterales bacterium]
MIAVIALVAALGGTAFAAGALTAKQKKQVGKIATNVFNKRIGSASVASANTANTANSASSANNAKTANTAKTATHADTAGNAEKLGGVPASQYQHVLQSSCPKNGAYEAIGSDGSAACIVPVTPIVNTPSAGEDFATTLPAGLQLLTICHDGIQVKMAFQNLSGSGATLNWFYGDGSSTSASGVSVGAGGEQQFSFSGARLEGQFIWSVGTQVVTVNLHAFDGTSFCEVRGTAESATS